MKRLLIGFCVVLSLLVAAVLVLPGLIDWNVYKEAVTDRIGMLTGRAVAIDGNVAFTLLPRPTLTASGVRVASVPRAAHPDMITIGALEARVSLLPLLGGRIEVERIVLVDPVLVLETLPDGSVNWGPVEVDPGGLPGAVSLGRLSIENGTVLWYDGRTGTGQRLSAIQAQGTARSLAGPMALVGSLEAFGVGLTVDLASGRLADNGMLPVNLTLGVDGLDAELRFAGLAGLAGQLQGDLTARGSDLAAVLRRFLPPTAPPARLARPFALRGALLAGPGRADFNSASFELGDTRATGSVTLLAEDTPRLEITLSLNRLPLESWLAAPQGAGAPDIDLWAAGGPDGFALPTGLTAAVELTVDAMEWRGGVIREARLEAGLAEDGVLTVSRLSAQLPGGSDLAVIAMLRAENGRPFIDASAEAAGGDLRGVLEWLGHAPTGVPSERLRHFTGAATLTGTPAEFQVTGAELTVDNVRLAGSLAYVARDRPGIGLRFAVDRLNLDAYGPAAAAAVAPERLAGLLRSVDATVIGEIGSLTVADTTLRGLKLDATVNAGTLTLREAAVADAAGAALRLSGSAATLDPPDGLDLALALRAPAAEPLFRALHVAPPVPADRLGAVSLRGQLRGGAAALVLELTGTAAGATATLGGSVQQPLAAPVYDLALRVTAPDALSPLQLMAPDYRPRRGLGGLDLYAVIGGTPQELRLDPVQGSLGPVTLAGRAALALDGGRPRVTAELRTGEMAVDPFLPARRPVPPAPQGALSERWSTAPLDLPALDGIDGTLALAAAALVIGDLRIDAPALRAGLDRGTLTLTRLSGTLFDGTLGLTGTLRGGARPALSVKLDLTGARLAAAAAGLLGAAPGDGTLDFGLNAATEGASTAELIGGLSGQGLIAVRDGTLRGLDLAAADRLLDRAGAPGTGTDRPSAALRSGETPFAALNIPFRIEAGVVHSESLRLVTPEGLGQGEVRFDLPRWRLELATFFALDRHPEAPPFGLRLTGPPDHPERRPETEALQRYLLQPAAEAGPPARAAAPAEPALRP